MLVSPPPGMRWASDAEVEALPWGELSDAHEGVWVKNVFGSYDLAVPE